MPKIKTRKSVAKRVKITGSGSLTHLRATRAHKLTKKSATRKRAYTLDHKVDHADEKNLKRMLGKR